VANSFSANVGDVAVVTGTATEADGDALDPTVVKGWTLTPSGTKTEYVYGVDAAITKVSTGIYKLTFDVDTAGTWYAGIYSTGTGKGASSDMRITVEGSKRL
jgi:hypothetical protein